MKTWFIYFLFGSLLFFSTACSEKILLDVTTVSNGKIEGLAEREQRELEEIRSAIKGEEEDPNLKRLIQENPNYTIDEYLALDPDANSSVAKDYRIGGNDAIDILVYEEADLSLQGVRVSAEGFISFPLLGRIQVGGMTAEEIEQLIARKLVEGGYILNAHVSVKVTDFNSKHYMILGAGGGGTHTLKANERVLDVLAKHGSVDLEQGDREGWIIRTLYPGTERETKIVIHINISEIIKGGVQKSNILLQDRDLIYIPKPKFFYVIGATGSGGKIAYNQKEVTMLEAILQAGGFSPTAATNRIRVYRIEEGVEKIYKVNVDNVLKTGHLSKDFVVKPGDVIVVPESYF